MQIHGLRVIYPDKTVAVDGLALTVQEGESVALIGANGAGKTSLMLALAGVMPFEGEVLIDGIPLRQDTLPQLRPRIGMVFQNPDDQLFMPTVYEDIAFGPRNFGMAEEIIEKNITECLEKLQITSLRDKTPLKLSGGEKRMAALATVLVMQPSLLLLDEPTAFLDPRARRIFMRAFCSLTQTRLVTTHDLSFAAETCARCVLMREGRVFADGASKELLYDIPLMEQCGLEAIGAYEKGVGI